MAGVSAGSKKVGAIEKSTAMISCPLDSARPSSGKASHERAQRESNDRQATQRQNLLNTYRTPPSCACRRQGISPSCGGALFGRRYGI
jgi:hypothetical protein